jgi:osmotically-inducible protein OsmY
MADIRTEVDNALHWDLAIPPHRVTAEVNGGLLTLHGVVDWAYQRSCAEAIGRRVPGVIGKLDLRQRVQWTGEHRVPHISP